MNGGLRTQTGSKTVRDIKRIILHCTATEEGQAVTVEDIDKWHKARGWKGCGYHFVLYADGTIAPGRKVQERGAHVKNENHDSIGVAYVGGILNGRPHDTMTAHQDISWLMLVNSLRTVFGPLTIHGHNEFSTKACPSFVVADKYSFLY